MTDSLVSVIIPTFNCRNMVLDCLESVKAQTNKPIELIIIDSRSSDGTRELAETYGQVYSFGSDPSHTKINAVPFKRNLGASLATGEYLYWFDTDMRMKLDTVQRCVQAIEKNHADAVIVPEESYGEGFWAQCRRLEKDCYNRNPLSLTDAARFLRKQVWDDLGGVDTTLGGPYDYDLQLRLNSAGYRTVKLSDGVLHYEGNLRLAKHLRKKFEYGTSAMRYLKKHRESKGLLTKQLSVVRADFLSQGDLLVKQPVTAAGMLVMKFLEYGAALCGIAYSQIRREDLRVYAGAGTAVKHPPQ